MLFTHWSLCRFLHLCNQYLSCHHVFVFSLYILINILHEITKNNNTYCSKNYNDTGPPTLIFLQLTDTVYWCCLKTEPLNNGN